MLDMMALSRDLAPIHKKLDAIIGNQDRILAILKRMEGEILMAYEAELTAAETAAKNNSNAEDSASALITTLAALVAQLNTGQTDPATSARITALATSIQARADAMAAAVVAGTPAA
jgi:hypothetical protein